MGWNVCLEILLIMTFCDVSHGILVVGPNIVQPNQQYKLMISNNNVQSNTVNVKLLLEGSLNGVNVYNKTISVAVERFSTKSAKFGIKYIPPSAIMKLTIEGINGFSFHKEVELELRRETISGLIQFDKPVYKHDDMVQFRVIVLDTELKPPVHVKFIHVSVLDSQNNLFKTWNAAELLIGVYDGHFQIPSTPMLGIWNIIVKIEKVQIVSKSFEVKEYVLLPVDLQIVPSAIPVAKDLGLNLTITAKCHSGKPLKGKAEVELFSEDDGIYHKKVFEMFGVIQQWLPFNNELDMSDNQQNVQLKVTFIELLTNYTVLKKTEITVYKYPYRMQLLTNKSHFKPGILFKCALQVRYLNGSPAMGISGEVDVKQLQYEKHVTSDDKGLIELELPINRFIELMDIEFTDANDGFFFSKTVYKKESTTNTYLNLEIKSDYSLRSTKTIDLEVTSNNQIQFLAYYVVAREEIIQWSFVKMKKNTKQYIRNIHVSQKMQVPRAKIVVITVSQDGAFGWDSFNVDFPPVNNQLDMIVNENKPGHEIEVVLRGRPGSYVGIAAYSQRFHEFAENHAIFVEDAKKLFNSLYINEAMDDASFHSTGLFVRTESHTVFGLRSNTHTSEYNANEPDINDNIHRSSFLESWLWKTVTIGRSGTHKLIDIIPNTSAVWYLTGFSIDPNFGLSIVKNPIQITSVPPFYIMDSLPYSIKRGEEAVLQFMLFSNRDKDIMVDVTLYNMADQIKFVERTGEDVSYTKTFIVPPNVGVPVSFSVIARKLGEITVRLQAGTISEFASVELAKAVRVMPENLVYNIKSRRFFIVNHDVPYTRTIWLDIPKQANTSAIKLFFNVYPNLLGPVIENLDTLLTPPELAVQTSLIDYIPSIFVLEYLEAIGSTGMDLKEKAKIMLKTDYQAIVKYRKDDGSFSNGLYSSGSVFITALVGESLRLASKHTSEVDSSVVSNTFDWLASKQHDSGRFDEVGEIMYHVMQDGSRHGVALTSYVLIAFLKNPAAMKHISVIQQGVQYISGLLPNITDVYDLSLATYALLLTNHATKDKALEMLITKSTFSDNEQERFWPRASASIATTAYGLLCLLNEKLYKPSFDAKKWLVKQQETFVILLHTLDTFVTLQALAMFAREMQIKSNYYSVNLQLDNTEKKIKITPSSLKEQEFEILTQTKKAIVNINGKGFGLYTFDYQYAMDIRNIQKYFSLNVTSAFTASPNNILILQVCSTFAHTLLIKRSNVAIVEVNFPSGFIINKDSVENLSHITNPIMNIELRFNHTTLMVYYASMGPEMNCFRVTATRQYKAAFQQPSYVLVHDMYNIEHRAIQQYEVPQTEVLHS